MAVSKRLRFEVYTRDKHACRYCGAMAPDVKLTIDHVVPVTLGGQDIPENLVTCCVDCNAGKSSVQPGSPLIANVAEDAVRWAQAMTLAVRAAERSIEDRVAWHDWFDDQWTYWCYGDEEDEFPREHAWRDSLDRFVSAGMTKKMLHDVVKITMASKARPYDKWKYFCGVCWRRVAALQEATAALIAEEELADQECAEWLTECQSTRLAQAACG